MKKNTKRHKLLYLLFALFIFLLHTPMAYAQEKETNEDKTLSPYFLIQGENADASCFSLKSTDVTVNINGMIADVCVVQTYTNEGDTPINARYVFPTSTNAAVHGMKMEIGNNVVTAQIKEKEKAKEEYQEAKSEGKSAALLEQQRTNVFTMDVANIMPGDNAEIELNYTELIYPMEGIYEFNFPTVVGPRYVAPSASSAENNENGGEQWTATPYLPEGEIPAGAYNITVNLSTGVPLADVSCKSHEITVTPTGDSSAQITLSNPEDYAGNRDFILKYQLIGEEIQSGLILTQNEKENFFLLTMQPPERYTPEEIPPREYIFVLDVSGSMIGYPLDTSKALIRDLVKGLNETDRFNLVLFASEYSLLSTNSLAATEANVDKAIQLIDKQEGGGGSALVPALSQALEIPQTEDTARSIVVITDGYISNEQDAFSLVEKYTNTASFFSFGIGSSVNHCLIDGIAKSSLGEAFTVTDSEDAAECAERFRDYIQSPLLTDIEIAFEGFDVYDVEPAVPSTLFAKKPIVLFGKWRGNPNGTVKLTGKSGNQEYVEEISVEDIEISTDNEALRYLWARTRLDRVAGYGSMRNDASTEEEILKLGLEYNLTTPYTSFVAVVDIVRNSEGNSKDVEQALPLPLNVSNLAVGGGYTAYSEPESILLIGMAMGAFCLSLLRRKRKRI